MNNCNMAASALPPRILIVEDSPDAAMILRFLLEREGYAVQHAVDGRQAQELIATMAAPDLVVLDVMLPFMSGLQLIDFIRKQPEWQSVPILMLTADATEHDLVLAFKQGVKDYVTKPFNPNELMARIRSLARRPSSLAL
jgi:two-component system, OmpR family, alkaline phosphatase synthesis response regulator PhoP